MIAPYKQLKFGLLFITMNIFFTALIVGTMLYYLWDIFSTIKIYFELIGQEEAMSFNKLLTPLVIISGLSLLFIGATLYMSIFYTHRFYGPMLSIERHLDSLIEGGRPGPLEIRKEDEFKKIVDKINQFSNQISNENETLK